MAHSKDYSSISPSAKSLLMMKGYTQIPYAQQTAALVDGKEIFDLNFEDKDFFFWLRVMHFESRYWSIDQLLKQTDSKNILELSSGYSLRGLALCDADAQLHYIDTDLSDVIAHKQNMIAQLQLDKNTKGKLELLPLNALDSSAFNDVINKFDNGPLTIVNEGLLMYLNMDEKKQLCKLIHHTLKQRGGCWITADVYIKLPADKANYLPKSKSEAEFTQQHNIEENKFDSIEQAHAFFKEQGFEMVAEATVDFKDMSALPQLLKAMPEEARNSKVRPPKIQSTWMLKAV
ncbi:MAG: class I SAM-dependent methyltransferase [Bacteroidetes bacterium]|nr:class I SAM-dependent methyltransferase [Bacteroidota bacterium]